MWLHSGLTAAVNDDVNADNVDDVDVNLVWYYVIML